MTPGLSPRAAISIADMQHARNRAQDILVRSCKVSKLGKNACFTHGGIVKKLGKQNAAHEQHYLLKASESDRFKICRMFCAIALNNSRNSEVSKKFNGVSMRCATMKNLDIITMHGSSSICNG